MRSRTPTARGSRFPIRTASRIGELKKAPPKGGAFFCEKRSALIGSVMSFAGVLMAAQAGETAALRLHASELLMMLGTLIVILIEQPVPPRAGAAPAGLSLQQGQAANP